MANETTVRQRKKRSNLTQSTSSKVPSSRDATQEQEDLEQEEASIEVWKYLRWVSTATGIFVMLVIGFEYALYMKQLHENNMWFSNIKEVEREISFRTESGLYYSYYKQLVESTSISQGLKDLTNDVITEHPSTINILARMNVYQEVVLASLYKSLPSLQPLVEPIYFYINAVFSLHAMLMCAIYIIAWILSGTWVAGVLTAAFYIFNRYETTRSEYLIPLRESFSLPFLWLQLASITCYFRPRMSKITQILSLFGIGMSTLLFALTWQFNQFILLLQAFALFGCQVLHIVPHSKIFAVYSCQVVGILLVYILQFYNTMLLTGFLFSFITAAIIVMFLQGRVPSRTSLNFHIFKVLGFGLLVLALTAVLNVLIKRIVTQEADVHIFKFVLYKFGYGNPRDFDVLLYICNGAFGFLSMDVIERMMSTGLFPIYVVAQLAGLVVMAGAVIKNWRNYETKTERLRSHSFKDRPEFAYSLVQPVFFGALAITTARMKYLWTPYVCIVASVGVSDYHAWKWILLKLRCQSETLILVIRHTAVIVVFGALLYIALPGAIEELNDLREFYDPDTVDLMEWIKAATPPAAAFTGSMQLLAGVKLCTGRHITNHPHYEDKDLRYKTKELYQMYAKRAPYEVREILLKYDASYIILEDSICMAPPKDGCRLTDLMDLDNRMMPDDHNVRERDLDNTNKPRFCDRIRLGEPDYKKYFKLVFENETFRVYQVLR